MYSLPDCSLLVYRKAICFLRYLSYSTAVINSFNSSNAFFVVTLGFSIHSILSSTKKQQLELDVEQQTGSKLGKDLVKAV